MIINSKKGLSRLIIDININYNNTKREGQRKQGQLQVRLGKSSASGVHEGGHEGKQFDRGEGDPLDDSILKREEEP